MTITQPNYPDPEPEYAIVHSGLFVGRVNLTAIVIRLGETNTVRMAGVIEPLDVTV